MDREIIASVIIPAFNEEKYIAGTLRALTVHKDLEVIVVDNGSTDATAVIAQGSGARVIDCPIGTIASVRNRGVQESVSDVLVFLDADVRVSSDWHDRLKEVIEKLVESPSMITGSRVRSANEDNWLHKYWYTELSNYNAQYINSGHLITTRHLYDKIDGFNDELETAEDYDFCMRAIAEGAVIEDNPGLVAVHDGYPDSLSGFLQRERWHGRQDVDSWQHFAESKIAWVALLNLIMAVVALIATLSGHHLAWIVYVVNMYLMSLALTIYKFGMKRLDYMLVMPVIFYLYLCGRSLSIVDRITKSKN